MLTSSKGFNNQGAEARVGSNGRPLRHSTAPRGHSLQGAAGVLRSAGCVRVAVVQVWDRRMGKVVKEARGHAQDATACVFFTSSVKPM